MRLLIPTSCLMPVRGRPPIVRVPRCPAAPTPYPGPVLCTRRLARRIVPELGRYNLDHLCAHFGISNRARHRALGDAAATATALVELLQLARARLGVETVGDLLDLHERKPKPVRRRSSRPSG